MLYFDLNQNYLRKHICNKQVSSKVNVSQYRFNFSVANLFAFEAAIRGADL